MNSFRIPILLQILPAFRVEFNCASISILGRLLWLVSIRLHYDSGKKACWPFAISQKIGVGRCFVASRDISPGELILYDASVTSGPRQGKVLIYKSPEQLFIIISFSFFLSYFHIKKLINIKVRNL